MMTFTYYSPDPLVFSQKTTHNLVTLRSCIFLTNKLVTLAVPRRPDLTIEIYRSQGDKTYILGTYSFRRYSLR